MKLNIGCGRDTREGWINLDIQSGPGVDWVCDLEHPPYCRWIDEGYSKVHDDTFDEILMSHVIEHLHKPLPVMQELHRIIKPDGILTASCPYGSSDDAFEDPTHYRQYFIMSWLYFDQKAYHKADYGYRGDWNLEELVLRIPRDKVRNMKTPDIMRAIYRDRNIVTEQIATLRAVKPIRPPEGAWQRPPVVIELV